MYPRIDSNDNIPGKSMTYYSNCIISMFTASYSIDCHIINCYACNNVCVYLGMYMHINI